MAKNKTEGEITFEKYLTDHNIPFIHEPEIGVKKPDYLLDFGVPVLVEVKDLGVNKLEKNILQEIKTNQRASWKK